ncbi:hypothetical protein K523DRAFT_325163 [Schizophyllum commune Tattone D]|nr:hypothetical protein K523DRAFT_325163 [Schizophyllum commune Tattone D]
MDGVDPRQCSARRAASQIGKNGRDTDPTDNKRRAFIGRSSLPSLFLSFPQPIIVHRH